MLYRRAVDNRNTGFWPFEREWAEPGPLPPAHYAHLHSTNLVLNRFKYSAGKKFFLKSLAKNVNEIRQVKILSLSMDGTGPKKKKGIVSFD